MPAPLSQEEAQDIQCEYPELRWCDDGSLEGDVHFSALHGDVEIEDRFSIKIEVPFDYPLSMPALIETGGRTQAAASRFGLKNIRDLHANPEGSRACLCAKQEEKIRLASYGSLKDFIEDLVVPYLYALSFFERYGRWPWKEYSHGSLGLLEYEAERVGDIPNEDVTHLVHSCNRDAFWRRYRDQLVRARPKMLCVCGSCKGFGTCHPKAYVGVARLREKLRRSAIDPRKLIVGPKPIPRIGR